VNDYQDFTPPAAPLADAPPHALELADRGARLGAKCLDYLTGFGLLLAVGLVAAICVPALMISGPARIGGPPHAPIALLLTLGLATAAGLIGLVVWNCVWLDRYGQTIGKRVARIRIVRSNGERASLGRIFALRYLPMTLLGAIPFLGTLITLTDDLLIFRESRQCLHDQIADTIVVKAG
jgi:uncharacterized RDD family membrane protein YckC